jgi:hypothetical protein
MVGTRNEPKLSFADAYKTAQELKSQGKAFRVLAEGSHTDDQLQAFLALGALYDVQNDGAYPR